MRSGHLLSNRQGRVFPLVWDFNINYVPAINVTQRYLDIYQEVYQSQLAGGNYVPLKVMMFKDKRNMRKSDESRSYQRGYFLW